MRTAEPTNAARMCQTRSRLTRLQFRALTLSELRNCGGIRFSPSTIGGASAEARGLSLAARSISGPKKLRRNPAWFPGAQARRKASGEPIVRHATRLDPAGMCPALSDCLGNASAQRWA
jgi:hypothetical protein